MKTSINKQSNKAILSFLALFLIVSCSSYKAIFLGGDFETLYTNKMGGTKEAGYLHIKDNETYIKTIESLKIEAANFNKLAQVDFSKNDVLILFLGEKNTSDPAIGIASLVMENEIAIVEKQITTPDSKEKPIQETSSMYSIATIPKAKKIQFKNE